MVKTKRMMETDSKGIKRQFFPISHWSAIVGLEEIMTGQSKVLSVNGKQGAVIITKADLGLENALTELPYANGSQDGIITAEMFEKILNSGEGDYVLPIATGDKLGGIKIGSYLSIDPSGKVSAEKQSDFNFSQELKEKLESLKIILQVKISPSLKTEKLARLVVQVTMICQRHPNFKRAASESVMD